MHPVAGLPAPSLLVRHPVVRRWMEPDVGVLHRLRHAMDVRGIHPSRCVVMLPYAQLRPLAQRLWLLAFDRGFAPRFETTRSWVASIGARADGPFDLRHDRALDLLTAQSLLLQAGQGAQADQLAGHLVDAAWQLAPLAAAQSPQARDAWAQRCRQDLGSLGGVASAQWEALVIQVALEWVRLSAYASDALFDPAIWQSADAVVQLGGLSPDPLGQGLQDHWGDARWTSVPWQSDEASPRDVPLWHAHSCRDALDEARRSAACAVRHVQAGRFPLALVSSDRALTRQIQAQLQASGLSVRDETGWKLSTTPAAAFVMAMLRAAAWGASTDAVVAWLKLAPRTQPVASALEARLRQMGERDWGVAQRRLASTVAPTEAGAIEAVQNLRARLQGRAPLTDWLGRMRFALEQCGYWPLLEGTAAQAGVAPRPEGPAVLQCLQLDAAGASRLHEAAQGMAWAQRPWSLAELTAWVNQGLEGASWSPDYPAQEHVVLVPLSQLLARPFAAVVLCGCDEVRLGASVPPPGPWTRAQREALGLPAREQLDQVLRSAWLAALDNPPVDVLWRTSDDTGEPLLPSALVQSLALDVPAQPLGDAVLQGRSVPVQPVLAPMPKAPTLPLERLSASGFDALRTCPYRFFALRLLGLHSADELDQDVDKRDFGLWLHEVLSHFHRSLAADATVAPGAYCALLDAAADAVTRSQGLAHAEFLPYRASWPAVRDHYLAWLQSHTALGFSFVASEIDREREWAGVTLHGRLDRMDRNQVGSMQVLDYKTESASRTRERVVDPLEDTQMAFYGALVQAPGDEPPAGSYLALGESECKEFAQPAMAQAVQALLDGIASDVQRIRAGAALPALGEGDACTHCDARGLCRKDTWAGLARNGQAQPPAPTVQGELPA